MDDVFFEPWIGNNYWNAENNEKKVLVIGNSHYCGGRGNCTNCGVAGNGFDYDCWDFTTSVVQKYLNHDYWEKWMGTYQKFERALCGYKTSISDSVKVWNSIAFYNYLQTAVANWNDPGKNSDYCASENSFWQVLEELRPDCILMWGNRLWNMTLAFNSCNGSSFELDDGTEVPVLSVHHPSWRFYEWQVERKIIKNFLNTI